MVKEPCSVWIPPKVEHRHLLSFLEHSVRLDVGPHLVGPSVQRCESKALRVDYRPLGRFVPHSRRPIRWVKKARKTIPEVTPKPKKAAPNQLSFSQIVSPHRPCLPVRSYPHFAKRALATTTPIVTTMAFRAVTRLDLVSVDAMPHPWMSALCALAQVDICSALDESVHDHAPQPATSRRRDGGDRGSARARIATELQEGLRLRGITPLPDCRERM